MNRMLGVCAALGLTTVAPAIQAGQIAPPAGQVSQTSDRLSPERMEALVSAPMALVTSGRLAAGKTSFDRLLAAARARHGERSVEVADLLTAFGVGIYTFGLNEADRQIKAEAIPYLEAAIPAYRAAFGNDHPEVAVALNSYADAQTGVSGANPPPAVDAARGEAYRISLRAFGPTNPETLASLRYLARLQGLPSRTRGEPARIEAAAALFRQLVSTSPVETQPEYLSAPAARAAFALMYAQNRMADEAREQLRLAIDAASSWSRVERCIFAAAETRRVEGILAGGAIATQDSILPELDVPDRCFALETSP